MGKAHEMLTMRTEAFPVRTGERHAVPLFPMMDSVLPLSRIPKRISGIHSLLIIIIDVRNQ